MSPQRRTALVSIVAACVLIAVKLVAGLATHSLGLLSEAAHSGTDLIAAILTFVALGVAVRPADTGHPYGHGKAEHLAALAEAAILVVASLLIAWRALGRLFGSNPTQVDPRWYALVVIALVIVVDFVRASVSFRAGRRYRSPALQANALHFASDLAGSTAVLAGLAAARAGYDWADSAAALFVAALVLVAAARLMRLNVDVLMDRVPPDAQEAALAAIAALPGIELRRLRMRQAAGRQFADVVVHVEPLENADLRERAHAAAVAVPSIREVHNLALVDVDGRKELSLHVKLPGDLSLEEAHDIAEQLETAICAAVPEIAGVQTHLEPLAETQEAQEEKAADEAVVRRIVKEATGAEPRALRFLRTDGGLVAFLTLGLEGTSRLDDAHAQASEIEERIRRERPDIADVVVHTEP